LPQKRSARGGNKRMTHQSQQGRRRRRLHAAIDGGERATLQLSFNSSTLCDSFKCERKNCASDVRLNFVIINGEPTACWHISQNISRRCTREMIFHRAHTRRRVYFLQPPGLNFNQRLTPAVILLFHANKTRTPLAKSDRRQFLYHQRLSCDAPQN